MDMLISQSDFESILSDVRQRPVWKNEQYYREKHYLYELQYIGQTEDEYRLKRRFTDSKRRLRKSRKRKATK